MKTPLSARTRFHGHPKARSAARRIAGSAATVLVCGVMLVAGGSAFAAGPDTSGALAADPAAAPDSGTHWSVTGSISVPYGSTVAVNPSTGFVYSSGVTQIGSQNLGLIYTADGATNTVTATASLTAGGPGKLAVSEASNAVFAPFLSGAIAALDGAGQLEATLNPVDSSPIGAAVDPSTDSVFVIDAGANKSQTSGEVYVVQAGTNTLVHTAWMPENLTAPVIDPGTHQYFTAVESGSVVEANDTRTFDPRASLAIPGAEDLTTLAVDPAKHQVYALDPLTSKITVIDTQSDTVVGSIPIAEPANFEASDMTIDPQRGLLFVSSSDATSSRLTTISIASGDAGSVSVPGFGPTMLAFDTAADRVDVLTRGGGADAAIQVLERVADEPVGSTPTSSVPASSAVASPGVAVPTGSPSPVAPSAELASTGADARPIALAGLTALGVAAAGAVIVWLNRRRRGA